MAVVLCGHCADPVISLSRFADFPPAGNTGCLFCTSHRTLVDRICRLCRLNLGPRSVQAALREIALEAGRGNSPTPTPKGGKR